MGQKSSTQTDRISKDIRKGTRSFAQYHDVSIQGVLPKGETASLCVATNRARGYLHVRLHHGFNS